MEEQREVAQFVDTHGIEAPPAYRLLDLVSEVGELSKDAAESTDYGAVPKDIEINEDEIGDVLFTLLAFSESLDIDAGDALETAIGKYENRITETGEPASGS